METYTKDGYLTGKSMKTGWGHRHVKNGVAIEFYWRLGLFTVDNGGVITTFKRVGVARDFYRAC
jgi:hypothetical protein